MQSAHEPPTMRRHVEAIAFNHLDLVSWIVSNCWSPVLQDDILISLGLRVQLCICCINMLMFLY